MQHLRPGALSWRQACVLLAPITRPSSLRLCLAEVCAFLARTVASHRVEPRARPAAGAHRALRPGRGGPRDRNAPGAAGVALARRVELVQEAGLGVRWGPRTRTPAAELSRTRQRVDSPPLTESEFRPRLGEARKRRQHGSAGGEDAPGAVAEEVSRGRPFRGACKLRS